MRSADVRTFVPQRAQPVKIFEHHLLVLVRRARLISILDADDERSLMTLREQPVEDGRARTADMEMSRRRWSKSDANVHCPKGTMIRFFAAGGAAFVSTAAADSGSAPSLSGPTGKRALANSDATTPRSSVALARVATSCQENVTFECPPASSW